MYSVIGLVIGFIVGVIVHFGFTLWPRIIKS